MPSVWRLLPFRLLPSCLPFVLLFACGGAETANKVETVDTGVDDATAQLAALGYPTKMLSGPGEGPALFLHDSADSPALGYLSSGVPVKLGSLPSGGRVLVKIGGDVKVRAWIPLDRLALRVQKRGRVKGTPTYAGPGDLLVVRGSAGPDELSVTVHPNFETEGNRAYDGTFSRTALSADATDPDAKPLSAGRPGRLPANTDISVYNKPDGNVVATIKSQPVGVRATVLKEKGEWSGVRIGVGPYVVGYVKLPVDPATETLPEQGKIPERLKADLTAKLWRIKNGARIRFEGKTVGIVSSEKAFAREINRYPESNEVDVFVAANDDVALRGMVAESDLVPTGMEIPAADDSPPSAPATVEKTEPEPPELAE